MPTDRWYDVPWDVWVSVAANVATVVALGIAVWQLVRAARAAERAERAALQTQTLSVISSLRDIERVLDNAIRGNDRDGAIRATREWRAAAPQAHGLLVAQGDAHPQMLTKLRTSLSVASRAKRDLMDQGQTVADATEKLTDTIADVCDEIGLIGSAIQVTQVEGEADGEA